MYFLYKHDVYPRTTLNFALILPLYRWCFLLPWVFEVLLLSSEGKVSHDTNSLQSSCIKWTRSKFPAEALKDITQINIENKTLSKDQAIAPLHKNCNSCPLSLLPNWTVHRTRVMPKKKRQTSHRHVSISRTLSISVLIIPSYLQRCYIGSVGTRTPTPEFTELSVTATWNYQVSNSWARHFVVDIFYVIFKFPQYELFPNTTTIKDWFALLFLLVG